MIRDPVRRSTKNRPKAVLSLMVGIIGFEPIMPEGAGLQPDATVPSCPIPKFFNIQFLPF